MMVVVTVRPVHTAELIREATGRAATTRTDVASELTDAYVASADLVAVTEHVPARTVCKKSPLMEQPAVPTWVTA
jgi:hypothetical protein